MTTVRTLRDLGRCVAAASTVKMVQVVKMVDAMVDRGSADDLLTPIRATSAHVMPARPLRLSRLLFLPLDSIIVQPARWRQGAAAIPRSAITPITRLVQAQVGTVAEVEVMVAGEHVGASAVKAAAGRLLWRAASEAVGNAAACPGWEADTGLTNATWPGVRDIVCGVWCVADRLVGEEASDLCDQEGVSILLSDVARRFPNAVEAVLAVLLANSRDPTPILQASVKHSDASKLACGRSISRMLHNIAEDSTASIGSSSLMTAAAEIERKILFLRTLEHSAFVDQRQVAKACSHVITECASRFEQGLADDVFAPLLDEAAIVSSEAVVAAEASARSLQAIERAARSLGATTEFTSSLAQAWRCLKQTGSPLSNVERARLAEILFGPDRAEVLLGD